VSLLDIVGEIGTYLLGDLLPGPSSIAGQSVLSLTIGLASIVSSGIGTHFLFSTGQPYTEPEWAFNTVVCAAVGGVFAFVWGLACWSKATRSRAVPVIASLLGLTAMLLFPVRLTLA
jgi:peptidoglycan/LPS O-acetylase OafA/YrhL